MFKDVIENNVLYARVYRTENITTDTQYFTHENDEIQFGIYACSPEDSSFKATFTNMELTECKWLAHDGQQPDGE